MQRTEDTTWILIRRLGYAGLAPFVILAFCCGWWTRSCTPSLPCRWPVTAR